MTTPSDPMVEWLRFPEAEAFVAAKLDEFVGAVPPARKLQADLILHTSSRLVDWLDHLVLADGDMSSHRVVGARFTIGRLGNNDLVLTDPSVSRHHAELTVVGESGYRVADLESMNGVYVNGRRVRERMLSDGDELEIGDVRLSFELRVDDPLERDSTREFDGSDTQASLHDGRHHDREAG